MWSFICDVGIKDVKDGSGFVRRRLVVRRAEDSWRQGVYELSPARDEMSRGMLAGDFRGRKMDMSILPCIFGNCH